MIRVLHIFHNMGNGGIEHFVMNYYRNVNREKVQFDFLTSVDETGYFDDEIQKMGGRLYHAYPFKKNPVRNYLSIAKIVRDNGYTTVHRHTGSAFGYFDLRAARSGGAKNLILHSHASSAGNKWMHKLSQCLLKIDCIRLACSDEAGRFLFGDLSFEIINNAIDADRFRFHPETRERIRTNESVENKFVVGHVGAFYPVKNHEFLLLLIEKLHEIDDRYVLWLIGDGMTKNAISQIAKEKKMMHFVKFWGNRKDVPDLLQAMDAFVLPSKHEGFNIAAVEAQCAGLKCYASAQCAGLKTFCFLPIENGVDEWVNAITTSTGGNREVGYRIVKNAGFDIIDAAHDLERWYCSL